MGQAATAGSNKASVSRFLRYTSKDGGRCELVRRPEATVMGAGGARDSAGEALIVPRPATGGRGVAVAGPGNRGGVGDR